MFQSSLSPSVTPSAFHSTLETHLIHKSFTSHSFWFHFSTNFRLGTESLSPLASPIRRNINKKAYTPGKRATPVCVWRLVLSSQRCLTFPSWGTPCDMNAIYTSLKSTFSGLQFRCWQYGLIFIRSVVIASETREMSRNSKWIWPYSGSRSSKVIDLGVNGKPICD